MKNGYFKINRPSEKILIDDIQQQESLITEIVNSSSCMVPGSIGQAVSKEIFKRNPKSLHVLDISENNLVELVRQLRSTTGYIDGDFKSFVMDCGSGIPALMRGDVRYDYILNLSALKHVRSEKDPYSLMRMIRVNILNTVRTIDIAKKTNVSKYFCVSTDKAANPVNMMGASKRIMEMFLAREGAKIDISTARFANVAFSDGSLLHGFKNRLMHRRLISAPNDVKRYFVTPKESGELCLLSTLLGQNNETFFPKLSDELRLTNFQISPCSFWRRTVILRFLVTAKLKRAKVEELLLKTFGRSIF